eukprot:2971914-Amphidinium_carterae.1
MSRHAKHWNALSAEARASWESQAAVARAEREQALSSAVDEAEARLDVALAQTGRCMKGDTDGPTMVLRSCKWTSEDMTRLAETLNDRKGMADMSQNKHALDAGVAPIAPELFQQAKDKTKLNVPYKSHGITSMYRDIARMRQYFETALIRIRVDGASQHYRFLLATLMPIRVSFLKVLAETLVLPDLQPWEYVKYLTDTPLHQWRFTDVHITCEDFFAGLAEDSVVEVCMQSFFVGTQMLASYGEYKPLQQVLNGLHHELNRHKTHTTKERVHATGSTHAEVSDASASDESSCCGSHVDDEEEAEVGSGECERAGVEKVSAEHDDAEYARVFAEVESERMSWANLGNDESSMFSTQVTGGMWQIERSRTSLYGLRTFVKKSTSAHIMATTYGLKLSAAFGFEKFGNDGAGALCRLWQQRYVFLTEAWTAAGCPPRSFPVLSAEFELDESLERELEKGNTEVRKRRDEILALRPS